jgi:hypothetical protein
MAMYSVPMATSEPLRSQHRVHEVHERRETQAQRQQAHVRTYTQSQKSMKRYIATKAANPNATMPAPRTMDDPPSLTERAVDVETGAEQGAPSAGLQVLVQQEDRANGRDSVVGEADVCPESFQRRARGRKERLRSPLKVR